MKIRKRIRVKGIVQGVGFRPFVYNLAKRYGLTGFIYNDSKGVVIEIQGETLKISEFVKVIKKSPPALSVIDEIDIKKIKIKEEKSFIIKESRLSKERTTFISPDIATCKDCLKELNSKTDRRFQYPFINCTNCGPRFTIIKDIPYDRKNTTMNTFKMCSPCRKEYSDPADRRFHAQPDSCYVCGPELKLLPKDKQDFFKNKKDKKKLNRKIIEKVTELLKKGKIVAIKGIGGFHLACDATNNRAVTLLRRRKYREDKPFAIMVEDFKTLKKFCCVGKEESRLLLAPAAPIVLLEKRKRPDVNIADQVAPGNRYFGVMLAYTPLHHIILRQSNMVLVMTSGNISDEPISFQDTEAFMRLKKIADYFLVHNRDIHIRCDDSVTRIFKKNIYILRRARGFVPLPVKLPYKSNRQILGVGAELKNTFCLVKNDRAFMSQHIGDLENFSTLKSYTENIEHFKRIFSIEPEVIVCDKHPEYLSTKYAIEYNPLAPFDKGEFTNKLQVQHHYAHILSCMADNLLPNRKVIGIAYDGLGYGDDGNLWGGEFFVCDYKKYKRVAKLEYIILPGGKVAIKEPFRMLISYLYHYYGQEYRNILKKARPDLMKSNTEVIKGIEQGLKKGIFKYKISSMGRLFDAVSSFIGVRDKINYEGQAAIELEREINKVAGRKSSADALDFKSTALADKQIGSYGTSKFYSFKIKKKKDIYEICFDTLFEQILNDIMKGKTRSYISSRFHNTVVNLTVDVCKILREEYKINEVVLSGGVFQNIFLLERLCNKLGKENFTVYVHKNVPTNDACISLGQVAYAAYKFRK